MSQPIAATFEVTIKFDQVPTEVQEHDKGVRSFVVQHGEASRLRVHVSKKSWARFEKGYPAMDKWLGVITGRLSGAPPVEGVLQLKGVCGITLVDRSAKT